MKVLILILANLLAMQTVFAGGVSDGGGGTTNPHPANPEWIVSSARDYAAPIITAWLNSEQDRYLRKSEERRLESPFHPLFSPEKDIFDIIKETKIELQMNEPCYNAVGEAVDGSIFASEAGAICISPFTMAPKLNEFNYAAETMALIFHEYTHFLGLDEDQADAIQRKAILNLMNVNYFDKVIEIKLLVEGTFGGRINFDILQRLNWMVDGSYPLEERELERVSDRILNLRRTIGTEAFNTLQYIKRERAEIFTAQFIRIRVLEDYLCVQNEEHEGIRQDCLERLDTAFQGDTEVTARRIDDIDMGPAYDRVIIHFPASESIARQEIAKLRDYFVGIREEIRDLNDFRSDITVFRK